ncbi:MAG: hypothetical protein J6L74_15995, partial [Pseudomonas sp.]|nr:hypothetical protein [Pseudomonas sp.]
MAKQRQCLTADCRFSAALLWIRRSSWRRNEAAFGDEVVVKTLVAGFDCYTAAPDFATASQPNAASFLRQLLRRIQSKAAENRQSAVKHCRCFAIAISRLPANPCVTGL